MSIKISGYLFTGPLSIDKASLRKNQKETVFAVVGRGGSAWDPTFRLIDLGRTGPEGVVFASHPRAASWTAATATAAGGQPPSIYLLDVATQDHLVGKLDDVVQEILGRFPLPSDIR